MGNTYEAGRLKMHSMVIRFSMFMIGNLKQADFYPLFLVYDNLT
jgi:hypothetical protein